MRVRKKAPIKELQVAAEYLGELKTNMETNAYKFNTLGLTVGDRFVSIIYRLDMLKNILEEELDRRN